MVSSLDEYPLHQVPLPVTWAGSSDRAMPVPSMREPEITSESRSNDENAVLNASYGYSVVVRLFHAIPGAMASILGSVPADVSWMPPP